MRSRLLAFVAGVWLLQQQAVLPGTYWCLLLLPLLAVIYRLRHRPALFPSLCILAALLAGFFWAAISAQIRLADRLPSAWEGQDLELVGVVSELPKLTERSERFLFDVERVLTPDAHVPQHVSLAYYAAGFDARRSQPLLGRFHPGERWRLTVRLKQPHGTYNPGGFDFEAWALERNIRATGYLKKSTRLDAMVWRPGYVIERLRQAVRDRFQFVLGGKPYEGVLRALAIGDQGGISSDDWQVFLRTGVNHLMSISGLHVTMVSGLFYALTLAIWRRVPRLVLRLPARKAAVVAGALAALGYALLSGFSVPTQRTVYMLSVVGIALWSSRNIGTSLVLAWALFVTTVLDPWAVLSPGFWLSFGAVAVMVFTGDGRLRRPTWLREAIHTQWAVTLGLVPLLLVLFQQVSLVSPLANAFAIPLVSLVVVPLTLLGAVIPIDTILLAAHTIMDGCMAILHWMSAMPHAVWQQHEPSTWTMLLAGMGILWMLMPRGMPGRWMGMPVCLPMLFVMPPSIPSSQFQAAVLDVGQGLAVVVRTANHALLYDAGPKFGAETDSGSWIVVPYLRSQGIGRLDGFIVSHDDLDHSGGAASVLTTIDVDWFASSLPDDHPLVMETKGARRCFAGQAWVWDGVYFEMLHPAWDSYAEDGLKDNFRSCVLKVSSPGGSLLIPGDIEADAEASLLTDRSLDLHADVLVAPHHGSKTSSTEAFINAVRPSITVFTVGYRNRFGHPKPEVVERYLNRGIRTYRSDQDGMVMVDFRLQGVSADSWRQSRPRYWLAESPDAR